MLDEKTRMMLEVANQLTADDIELIKATLPVVPNGPESEAAKHTADPSELHPPPSLGSGTGTMRGQYERGRTRESKVSTACIGTERTKHSWWPTGTHIVGRIGSEEFSAKVVENARVKSGRGIVITSGPANGRVCSTPTRAALEATEDYRQTNGLGRGGGVTNGWTFWKPMAS